MNSLAIADLMALLPIAGPPAQEGQVAAFLEGELRRLGIGSGQMAYDQAQLQSEYGGEVGNLIVQINGRLSGPRLMFSTHMDTVPDAVGCQPRLDEENGRIVNDAAETALGGDNRLGCAVLLNLVRELMKLDGEHPPITLVFFVQEEVGLVGARGLDLSLLGEPAPTMCFNLDGGYVEQVVTAVIGSQRFTIDIEGIPAHAGARPAAGVSAAMIAAMALAELQEKGWHGRIEKPAGIGTSNVGIVSGGQGSNVVMPHMHILAEARSHDPTFRQQIIGTWQAAFRRAASTLANRDGAYGAVSFGPGPTYEAFALSDNDPVVQKTLEGAALCGLPVRLVSNDGGMDANWIVGHGIPAVTIAPGQRNVHTTAEWIDLHDFERACQLIVAIATGKAV